MRKCKHRIRCPNCQSLNTKRQGKRQLDGGRKRQRWHCHNCKSSFTPYKEQLNLNTCRLYFEKGCGYRETGRTFQIAPITAWNKTIPFGFNCKSPLEVSLELKPKWSGFLLLDGDAINVLGKEESLLLGVDVYAQDIPVGLLVRQELKIHWVLILNVLKIQLGYPFKGVVSDGDPRIKGAVKEVTPDVPYQICIKHYEDFLRYVLRYQFKRRRGMHREYERFIDEVHQMLYAPNIEMSKGSIERIIADTNFKRAGLADLIDKLIRDFPYLITHFLHPGLPRTNSIIEGVISRLDRRINPTNGFQYHKTAWATIKMMIMRYRFKPFTDSRNKKNNHKAPLELAGVDVSGIDWLKFSQRSSQPKNLLSLLEF